MQVVTVIHTYYFSIEIILGMCKTVNIEMMELYITKYSKSLLYV